jgi:hypothetical protein
VDDRIPRAFAVAVAVLLLVASGALFPHAGETKYPHTVDEVSADEVPDEASVIDYESLSPEGKRVIDEGAAAEDGDVTLYDDGLEKFEYTDTSGLGEDVFYVQQGSTYYRVETYTGGLDVQLVLRTILRGVAGVVALSGAALYYLEAPAYAVGLGLSALPLIGLRVYERVLCCAFGRKLWLALLVAVLAMSVAAPAAVGLFGPVDGHCSDKDKG